MPINICIVSSLLTGWLLTAIAQTTRRGEDKGMPVVVLASTRDDQIFEIDPGFADQIGLLVVVENGDLELKVVRRLVNGEAKLLIPASCEYRA